MAIPLDDHRIQLTFSKIAHLRDRSLKIDEAFLNAYADGQRWARICFDEGWDGRAQAPTVTWTPARMAESREEVQTFAP